MTNPSAEALTAADWWYYLLKREVPAEGPAAKRGGMDHQVKSDEDFPDLTAENLARFKAELARLIQKKLDENHSRLIIECDRFGPDALLQEACRNSGISSLRAFPLLSQSVIGPKSVMVKSGVFGHPVEMLSDGPSDLAA